MRSRRSWRLGRLLSSWVSFDEMNAENGGMTVNAFERAITLLSATWRQGEGGRKGNSTHPGRSAAGMSGLITGATHRQHGAETARLGKRKRPTPTRRLNPIDLSESVANCLARPTFRSTCSIAYYRPWASVSNRQQPLLPFIARFSLVVSKQAHLQRRGLSFFHHFHAAIFQVWLYKARTRRL